MLKNRTNPRVRPRIRPRLRPTQEKAKNKTRTQFKTNTKTRTYSANHPVVSSIVIFAAPVPLLVQPLHNQIVLREGFKNSSSIDLVESSIIFYTTHPLVL